MIPIPSLTGGKSESKSQGGKLKGSATVNPNIGINGQHGFSLNVGQPDTIKALNFGISTPVIVMIVGALLALAFVLRR